jgi:preprotein translocase SecE subunit
LSVRVAPPLFLKKWARTRVIWSGCKESTHAAVEFSRRKLISKGRAMAVAVKNATKPAQGRSGHALAVSSLLGAAYVLACLALLFYAVPRIWAAVITPLFVPGGTGVSAVDRALLAVALVAVTIGLAVLGKKLAGPSHPLGMRAGMFLGVAGVLLIVLIVRVIGGAIEATGRMAPQAGLILVGVLAAVLLAGMIYLFFLPSTTKTIVALEQQGWFEATSYKRTQGMRVRRATIFGFLIVAGFGVYSYRGSLESIGSQDLEILIPFTGGYTIKLLPDLAYTLPILLVAGSIWIGWRLVNYPPFADFLIATEAEMNKVSWTTRKRLIQDTIIVLTTMVLLTVFLFVVDILWFKILSNPWVPILQTDQSGPRQEQAQQEW